MTAKRVDRAERDTRIRAKLAARAAEIEPVFDRKVTLPFRPVEVSLLCGAIENEGERT